MSEFLVIALFFVLIIFSVIEPDVKSSLEEKSLLSLCSTVSLLHPKRFEVNVQNEIVRQMLYVMFL